MQETTPDSENQNTPSQGNENAGDASQKVEATIHRVADATASTVRDVGLKGEQLRQQWIAKQDMMVEGSRECVRNHPLTSVALAALAGMLLNHLCNGSRRSGRSGSCA